MNERSLDVLSQYDLVVERTARGRGTYLVWTDRGLFQLCEYSGTESRLRFEAYLLDYIQDAGFDRIDTIYRTGEEMLYSQDEMGTKYVLKKWYEGRECDVKKNADIIAGVQTLACLHLKTENIDSKELKELAPEGDSIIDEYERHNRELRRVRNFIRGRKRKTQFEYDVLMNFDEYYGYAEEACKTIEQSGVRELEKRASDICSICHGTYNHHNLVINGNSMAVVNFNHSAKGLQLKDLYFFLRKIMEKNDWNVRMGGMIIEKYNMIKSISNEETGILKIMLSYPEKFWKVLNQYNNSNKSWIPDKNIEKLKEVYRQQELKKKFVQNM